MSDSSPEKPPEKAQGKPNGKHPDPAFEPRKRRKGRGKQRRRIFTAQYKLGVLEEVEALEATGDGQIAAILRREGLYSSHLTHWRKQRKQGELDGLGKQRGRKPDPDKRLRREMDQLRADNDRLQTQLKKANAIIDVQKKLCELLDLDPSGSGS